MIINEEIIGKMLYREIKRYPLGFILQPTCVKIATTEDNRFTIAEIICEHRGYKHHFFGLTALHPGEIYDKHKGISVALKEAVGKMMFKFMSSEPCNCGEHS
ncbi:MAG: hypothetical protein WC623_21960 [Pedobacter sp.]|uniref:hypothetical protein n=1 Tax=Pedobacter sp. TaxID=1411316 RepID=UPI003562FF05